MREVRATRPHARDDRGTQPRRKHVRSISTGRTGVELAVFKNNRFGLVDRSPSSAGSSNGAAVPDAAASACSFIVVVVRFAVRAPGAAQWVSQSPNVRARSRRRELGQVAWCPGHGARACLASSPGSTRRTKWLFPIRGRWWALCTR
jgi:hypothetical protein